MKKEAAAMVWIYNWDRGRGGAHGTCRWAVAGIGVNGSMQEQEETSFESAGELEGRRDMRGNAELRDEASVR